MKQYNELFRLGKYPEAEMLAMRAKELDPDNPMAAAAVAMASTAQPRPDESAQGQQGGCVPRSMNDGGDGIGDPASHQAMISPS